MKIFSLLIIIFLLVSCSPPRYLEEISRLRSKNSELKTKVEKLEKESEERKKYVEIVSAIVEEVYRELRAIDTGYITLYSGELAGINRTGWEKRRSDMLVKIDQVKKLVFRNQELVMALKVTRHEKEKFRKLAKDLQEKLDNKRVEINQLADKIFDLHQRVFKLQNEKLDIKGRLLDKKTKISEINSNLQEVKNNFKIAKKKWENMYNKKYILWVTNKDERCYECSTSTFHIREGGVRVVSNHPEGSYEFSRVKKRYYTLSILDYDNFWKISNLLVIYYKE